MHMEYSILTQFVVKCNYKKRRIIADRQNFSISP